MALNHKLLAQVRDILNEKQAFVPMPGGDPGMGGGAPMDPAAAGGMPPPGDPSMGGGMPPMDPAAAGGMPPMDPAAAGGMPPPPPPADPAAPMPAPPSQGGMINMTADEFLKFVKQIVSICTSGKFGNDQRPADGGPVSDGQAALNAKVDTILNAVIGPQG